VLKLYSIESRVFSIVLAPPSSISKSGIVMDGIRCALILLNFGSITIWSESLLLEFNFWRIDLILGREFEITFWNFEAIWFCKSDEKFLRRETAFISNRPTLHHYEFRSGNGVNQLFLNRAPLYRTSIIFDCVNCLLEIQGDGFHRQVPSMV